MTVAKVSAAAVVRVLGIKLPTYLERGSAHKAANYEYDVNVI